MLFQCQAHPDACHSTSVRIILNVLHGILPACDTHSTKDAAKTEQKKGLTENLRLNKVQERLDRCRARR